MAKKVEEEEIELIDDEVEVKTEKKETKKKEEDHNNKKVIIIILVIVALLIIGLLLYFFVFKKDKDVTQPPSEQQNEEVTITFDTDGGDKVDNIKVEKGKTAKLPNPTKDGYSFVGWYLDDEVVDDTYVFNKDVTLKANWEEKKTVEYYTITFDSKGGSTVKELKVECEKELKLPTNPTRTGYKFVSWEDKNGKVILDGALLSCEDVTLYANWEKEEKYYTVTFDSKGGSSVKSIKVECNKELKLPANPTREGYEFISWYDKNGKTIHDKALLSCENITLYADWKKKEDTKYYNVTFDSKGGSSVSSIKVECGKELKLPSNPKKDGYSFVAWKDKNGVSILDGAKLSCEDVTLYAEWNENKKYICPDGYELKDTNKCVKLANSEKYCENDWKLVKNDCINPNSPNIKGTRTCPSKTYNGWTGTGTYYEAGRGYCGYEELTSYIGAKTYCENNGGTYAANNHCYKHIEIDYKTECASDEKMFAAQEIAPGNGGGCYQVASAKKKCPDGYTNASTYGECAIVVDATLE